MTARITAAEAATILRDLARGREDGNGGDVWPLYGRAEDAMAAVIGLAAESDAHRTRADAAEADRDALRAENTDLATVAYRAASLAVERNRWRARAEMVGARVNDAERITAEAMRQGLAACRDLRGRLRGEGLRLARAVAVVTAVRHEHATRAAWLATLPACASAPAGVVAAEAATRAALDGVTP